jgi:hypothetical protein
MKNTNDDALRALLRDLDPVATIAPQRIARLSEQILAKARLPHSHAYTPTHIAPPARLDWMRWTTGTCAMLLLGFCVGQSIPINITQARMTQSLQTTTAQPMLLVSPWSSWVK